MVLPANFAMLYSGFSISSIPITLVGICGVSGWLIVLLWADDGNSSDSKAGNTWLPWHAPWRVNGALAITGALCFAASGGMNNRADELALAALNLLGAGLLTLTPRRTDEKKTMRQQFNQLAQRFWVAIRSNPTRSAAVAYTASALIMLLGGILTHDLPRAACGAWFVICSMIQSLVPKPRQPT